MKVVVQRCKRAKVSVNNQVVGAINEGVMLLVGFTQNDSLKEIKYLADKVINLRIFDDENGVMNKSLKDVNGSILSISQFTLYADTSRGRRPSYIKALNGKEASNLYDKFNEELKNHNIHVETGIFGSEVEVDFINDVTITIILEKEG